MSDTPTVLVLGRRKTDNMPSLTRMLEILKPREGDATPGMDATVSSSVRITGCPDPHMTELAGVCEECGAVGTHESWCSRRK